VTVVAAKKITQIMREYPVYQNRGFRGLGRMENISEERQPYRDGVTLCIERPRLITESYKNTEGEPIVLRRAKALAHLLDNMTLYILPNERIVGNATGKINSLIHYPELFWKWLDKYIEKNNFKSLLTNEEREELHGIHKYWKGKSLHGMERNLLPEKVQPYWSYLNQGVFAWIHGGFNGAPNFDKVFKIGLNGFLGEAREKLDKISSDPDFYHDAKNYIKQKNFLEAAIITLEAAIRFGKRFSEKALELAGQEPDEKRKNELHEIAKICTAIPGNPPESFYEALQSYWLITLIYRLLDRQAPGLGERIDQILYPYYKKDKDAGKITEAEAQELIEHLILRINDEGQLYPPALGGGGGFKVTQRVITIGGQTPLGEDATNDLTYIILNAIKTIGFVEPAVAVRLHKNTPEKFYHKIVEVLKDPFSNGILAFFNDEMMVPYLTNVGIPVEDARDWANQSCMKWAIPGKAMVNRQLGGFFSLPKCLEYALNQGKEHKFLKGVQVGEKTPDPLTFSSFEDLVEAYLTQIRFFLEKLFTIWNIVDALEEEWMPQPFLSAMLDGCIENGTDCREYKYYADSVFQPTGQTVLANSLAVIKKLVFDDKSISMADLLKAMENNWEGYEDLRNICLTKVPKFGNDDDYVDFIARDIALRTSQVVRSFKNIYGGIFMEDGTGGATYYSFSGLTGATADGRKDGEIFNDGTISPIVGTDKKGPTAVLSSVSKVDHSKTCTHCLNQKIQPLYLTDEHKDSFIAYLRSFVDLGIHHIQFNVLDKETLLEAQEKPEEYGDLVVRVAGFAAYYVDLENKLQSQIIERTAQQLAPQ